MHSDCIVIMGSNMAESHPVGGELLLRWGVFEAGFVSARDPRYTVIPQKQRAAAAATQQQV